MVSTYIKSLKEAKKVTTKALSLLTNIPEPTINKILTGQTENPSFDSVTKLIIALGGSVDELLGINKANPNTEIYLKTIQDKDDEITRLCSILDEKEKLNAEQVKELREKSVEIDRLHSVNDERNEWNKRLYKIAVEFGVVTFFLVLIIVILGLVIIELA